jgi:alkylated DNA repair protein alkB family protein 7
MLTTFLNHILIKSKIFNFGSKLFSSISDCNSIQTIHNINNNENNELSHYLDSDNEKALEMINKSMKVIEDFVTESEEIKLINEIEPYMKRLRYESSHWDDAIHQYRETERLKWSEDNQLIIDRIRQFAFPKGIKQIKYVHILDLAKNGYIKPHVDSVRVGFRPFIMSLI